MKLLIEKISATRTNGNGETVNIKTGYKNVWIRRDPSVDKSQGGGALDNMFLGGFEKPGRLAFQIMSDEVITKLGIEEGKDLNDCLPTEVAIKVIETTEKENQPENIRLSMTKPKINPTTGDVLTAGGKEIYSVTVLIPLTDFTGDELVSHDKEI